MACRKKYQGLFFNQEVITLEMIYSIIEVILGLVMVVIVNSSNIDISKPSNKYYKYEYQQGPEECPLQLFYAWLYGTGIFFMVFNFISFLINIGRKFWGIPHLEKDEITTKEVMSYLCSRGLLLAFRILIMMFNLGKHSFELKLVS